MKRAGFSLTGIYGLFSAAFLTASLALGVGWYYQAASRTLLLALYLALVLLLAAAFLWQIRRMVASTIDRIDEMLDNAIANPTAVLSYDEARLSQLENRLYRLLTVSSSSAASIAGDRNRIQTLVADISHQTKTPLANILLYAQLLEERADLSDDSLKLARQITFQSEKLGFLIQALVKISRLETGIIRVAPQPASVGTLLQHGIDGIAEKAREKGVEIRLSCSEELQALFDPKWTEEAIGNILDNAVKYTPGGGIVSISAVAYEMFTRIDIADTGIGIDEQEINRIFQRFYRSSRVAQDEGVGIGLYLAREIISLQGGYIKVKSKNLDGSLFSVFLPNL